MSRRSWALFAAMCVIWGIPYLLIRVAVRDVSPGTLVFFRTVIGGVVLLPLALRAGGFGPVLRRWKPLLAFAAIEIALRLGYRVETRVLELRHLLNADEAFFTGTAAEITPIREVDGDVIGSGRRGPVTERIQKAFFDATSGRDARFQKWLRVVEPVQEFVAA